MHIKRDLKFVFYGDCIIDPPPANYEDALEVYQSLPRRSVENTRVVSFSITPIAELCKDPAVKILNEISEGNMDLVSKMMMDFNAVEKFIRKLKNTRLALDFSRYRAVLLDLETRFEQERSSFQSRLQTLLPQLRADAANEQKLTDLITDYNNSPFEKERFMILLGTRQKEIETAEFIIYHPELPAAAFIGEMSTDRGQF